MSFRLKVLRLIYSVKVHILEHVYISRSVRLQGSNSHKVEIKEFIIYSLRVDMLHIKEDLKSMDNTQI